MRRHVGLRDQRVHFLDRQKRRQRGPGARRPQIVGRAVVETAVEHEKAVEAAHRGDRAGDRARRQAAAALFTNERLERLPIQRFDRPAGAGGKGGERRQIARVALERVARQPALDAQVIEVRVTTGGGRLTTPDSCHGS